MKTSETKKIIVVGAGFKGMIAALQLVNQGFSVTLLEGSKKLGGVLNSPSWDGIYIDLGCHLFFNQKDEFTKDILKIIEKNYTPVLPNYASYFNKRKTEGLAIPDFESLIDEEKIKIRQNLTKKHTQNKKLESLQDVYINRFGDTASYWINECILKSHGLQSNQLDPLANNLLPFERIRIFPIKKAIELKKDDWFDKRIAVPRKFNTIEQSKHRKYDFFEYYPSKEGLHFFCKKLHQILLDKGVEIHLNTQINSIQIEGDVTLLCKNNNFKAQMLYWASPVYHLPKYFNLNSNLEAYLHSVPLVLFYFIVNRNDVSNYTYFHNYDRKDYCFRFSIQSNYAENNIPEDKALICCEVPVKIESSLWKNPENFSQKIWDEAIKTGVVKKTNFEKFKILQTPSAFKLPLKGYSQNFQEVYSKICNEKILGISSWNYSKNDIMSEIRNELNKMV